MVVKAASSPGGPPVEQLPLNSAPPVLARSARWHVWEHLDPVYEIAEHEGRVPERHTEDGHPPRLTCSRSIFRIQALTNRATARRSRPGRGRSRPNSSQRRPR